MNEMVEELEEKKKEIKDLQKRCSSLYKIKEQMKEENYKLRGENKSLKKRNYELTILIDTFLNVRKKDNKNMGRLTDSQMRVYLSIKKYIAENRISPSVRDLCEMNGMTSTSSMNYHLKRLKKMGYITYRDRVSRSIVVLGD